MAKRKSQPTVTVTDTGIYGEKSTTIDSDASMKDASDLFDELADEELPALDERLSELQAWAMRTRTDKSNPAHTQRAAAHVASYVKLVRNAVASNDAALSAMLGMDLGQAVEELETRLCGAEANAMRGRKNKRATDKANEIKTTKSVTTQRQIQSAVMEKAMRSRLSITAAGQRVADEHVGESGWSWGNVKNAILGMKKPKK